MKKYIFILIAILSLNLAYANVSSEVFSLESKNLSEERKIVVKLPDGYFENKNEKYPVIYVLDAETELELTASLLHRMHLANEAHQHIVVGIYNTNRTRDLAPTVNYDPRGPVGQGGGADKFLDFIEKELIPQINKQYRTSDNKTIVGSSIGGLFVLHSLQSRPHLFQAHLAYSPAVWWGARETLKQFKAFVKNSPNLENFLYISIGNEGGEMREVYDSLEPAIQKYLPKNLGFKSDKFQDVPHGLVLPAGLLNGFRFLFEHQKGKSI
ncbi:alpha/beta hydrolase [Rheinheimera sp. MMS21-TC3]|uniref:alpha/beta hydrolase n=1 Tax=Rheinheimera sp. MMS21-TC3 TaxID=3072790 RepID=UPI0028C3F39C|nr:alpha/beta hydrolase-fold protein [Rheinheimera sp. MMS21-TC3]WNO59468.1 alpha/beta hydrolase-fold protein [Rheinheimera sp. MMS21-TC3]